MEFRADVAIFGAGMTGLACSCFTSRDHLVFEKELVPGGACRTDEVSGFFFDFAEHFMRAPSSEILGFYETVAGDELVSQELRSGIWYRGRVVPYPFQKNIYYLDDEDKLRCLKGFFERQSAADECDPSFAGWFHRMYGKGIAELFMTPYNRKLWCVSPDKLAADFSFDPNLIPPISTEEMLEYALLPIEKRSQTSSQRRYYMRNGGIGSFTKRLAARAGTVVYGKECVRLDLDERVVEFSDGSRCRYNQVVSTLPLDRLMSMCTDVPDAVRDLASRLQYNSVHILNIALSARKRCGYHWVYVPDTEYSCSRVYFLRNFADSMVPAEKDSVSILSTFLPQERPDFSKRSRELLSQAVSVGLIAESDILFTHEQIIEYGFPIPLLDTRRVVDRLLSWLSDKCVFSVGRYGEWSYMGIEHAIMTGMGIDRVLTRGRGRS